VVKEIHIFLEENVPSCAWDDDTCAQAAEGGYYLHVLKWLREENDERPFLPVE
jgi:hypothetical protein